MRHRIFAADLQTEVFLCTGAVFLFAGVLFPELMWVNKPVDLVHTHIPPNLTRA